MSTVTPVLLLILDGFGHRLEGDDNAILAANTPNIDNLKSRYAYGVIDASEGFVGLPSGQFGNSEVGHLNIGAGRVVQQWGRAPTKYFIDISAHPPGQYYLTVQTNVATETVPLILQR